MKGTTIRNRHGFGIEVVRAPLCQGPAGQVRPRGAAVWMPACQQPRARMRSARRHVQANFWSIASREHELGLPLVRGGGAAALLAFDVVGESAQTWLHLGGACRHLDFVMTDGDSHRRARTSVTDEMREALARSACRRPPDADELAKCLRAVFDRLDTDEALVELGLRAVGPHGERLGVISLYVEPPNGDRHARVSPWQPSAACGSTGPCAGRVRTDRRARRRPLRPSLSTRLLPGALVSMQRRNRLFVRILRGLGVHRVAGRVRKQRCPAVVAELQRKPVRVRRDASDAEAA